MAFCLTVYLAFACSDTDVAPWPMYGQNAAHGRNQLKSPVFTNESVRWSYHTKQPVYGAASVGKNEIVYFSSWDGYVSAISPEGLLIWTYNAGDGKQIWSTPALAPCSSRDVVYVGANKSLLALRQSNMSVQTSAEVMWSVQTGAILASPSVDVLGVVYIGSLDGSFVAVRNGTVLWEHKTHPIYASAAVSNTTVFCANMEGEVFALNLTTGVIKWSVRPSKRPITSSPSLSPDGTIVYVAGQDGHLRAFSTVDGQIKWAFNVGFVDGSSPAVSADGTIYIGSLDSYLYAVNASGVLRWKFKANGQIQSSPAIGAAGQLYFNSFRGTMYCVDATSGEMQWQIELNSPSFSSPSLGRHGLYIGASFGVAAIVGPVETVS